MSQVNQNQGAVATTAENKGKVTYSVAGEEVTLSYDIVRRFLTKGNGNVADTDLTLFISICKYNQLNPFLNEAYLVKYGDQPAQMVVAKEAFLKRAEAHENYEGLQAGVLVKRGDDIIELEGSFFLETDVLLGGWAKVYRSDRKYPYVSRVRLSEYDKNQSVWKEKKATMISKVAKVQALREAFPAQLGAMYTPEEVDVVDTTYVDVTQQANKQVIGFETAQAPAQEPTVISNPEKVETKEQPVPTVGANGQTKAPF
jgi:phage recombination protein Bet